METDKRPTLDDDAMEPLIRHFVEAVRANPRPRCIENPPLFRVASWDGQRWSEAVVIAVLPTGVEGHVALRAIE